MDDSKGKTNDIKNLKQEKSDPVGEADSGKVIFPDSYATKVSKPLENLKQYQGKSIEKPNTKFQTPLENFNEIHDEDLGIKSNQDFFKSSDKIHSPLMSNSISNTQSDSIASASATVGNGVRNSKFVANGEMFDNNHVLSDGKTTQGNGPSAITNKIASGGSQQAGLSQNGAGLTPSSNGGELDSTMENHLSDTSSTKMADSGNDMKALDETKENGPFSGTNNGKTGQDIMANHTSDISTNQMSDFLDMNESDESAADSELDNLKEKPGLKEHNVSSDGTSSVEDNKSNNPVLKIAQKVKDIKIDKSFKTSGPNDGRSTMDESEASSSNKSDGGMNNANDATMGSDESISSGGNSELSNEQKIKDVSIRLNILLGNHIADNSSRLQNRYYIDR